MDGVKLYGVPPGEDLPLHLVDLLIKEPPDQLARTTVLLNTRRMERRVRALFDTRAPCLLPRIDLVAELKSFRAIRQLPPQGSDIRRLLRLTRALDDTLRRLPDIAHPAAAVELAQSVGAVLDEMQIEGVPPDTLGTLQLDTQSDHWDRSRQLLEAFGAYLAEDPTLGGLAAHTYTATQHLIATWQTNPPDDRIILAGSTGSRGTTFDLMCAVAGLPRGIVILPGFDFDLPDATWDALCSNRFDPIEDHPQYRFARLLSQLGLSPKDVRPLGATATPLDKRRALVSLSLRPAPVTDAWLGEGPELGPLAPATDGLTLLEADTLRDEADAIALILRGALEEGKTAAVITRNRTLTRRIASALDRWRIVPDDSAGEPLAQTPAGRLVLQLAALPDAPIPAEDIVSLLKHPLVCGGEGRGPHLRLTRELELWIRRNAVPFIDVDALGRWAEASAPADAGQWIEWLATLLERRAPDLAAVNIHAARTIAACEALAAGVSESAPAFPRDDPAGSAAISILRDLEAHAEPGHRVTPDGWRRIVDAAIRSRDVREAAITDSRIMFWGPLEARVHGADRVIVAGLNEGTWPETPTPDPWLNRSMRQALGLLSPERSVGLAAHDFQGAVCSGDVILTRSREEDGAITVPSRWVSRLTNLLDGLPGTGGTTALEAMRRRGDDWLSYLTALRQVDPVQPEQRPAPCPPLTARPKRLSVTAIQRLIRDPYAIYASHVLGLRKLGPLRQVSDPLLRGQILHEIFERFSNDDPQESPAAERARLLSLAAEVLERDVPWPAARRLWNARIARIADAFIVWEMDQRGRRIDAVSETTGHMVFPEIGFRLDGRADRITMLSDGTLEVVDYKTGKAPTRKEIENFDRQLVLEALIAEAGGFEGVGAAPVSAVTHIGLSPDFSLSTHRVGTGDDIFDLAQVRRELIALIAAYQREDQGFAARRAMASVRFDGDYDHLSRFGEWDEEATPVPVTLA